DLSDQATLEATRPQVQWAPSGADFQTVADRQTVRAGSRIRTSGANSAARLVYFEGTVTEVGADAEVTVQRLERSPGGNIVTTLLQNVGTTVSRVVQLTDPAASFEVETPSARAIVRGTTPRVKVNPDGTTRVQNLPDGTGGLVRVRGRDPARTEVTLLPVQQTIVVINQPPGQASPLTALISLGPGTTGGTARLLSVRNTGGGQQRTVQVAPGQETRIAPGPMPSQPPAIATTRP